MIISILPWNVRFSPIQSPVIIDAKGDVVADVFDWQNAELIVEAVSFFLDNQERDPVGLCKKCGEEVAVELEDAPKPTYGGSQIWNPTP